MALAVAGDFSPEEVLAVADRLLKPAPDTPSPALLRKPPVESFREPAEIARERVEEAMPVAAPLFYLGYKALFPENEAGSAVLLELLAGKASPLYARLMEQGLINEQFGASYFSGPGFGCYLFGGESADPDAVCAAVREEVARLQREGLDQQAFERSRRPCTAGWPPPITTWKTAPTRWWRIISAAGSPTPLLTKPPPLG